MIRKDRIKAYLTRYINKHRDDINIKDSYDVIITCPKSLKPIIMERASSEDWDSGFKYKEYNIFLFEDDNNMINMFIEKKSPPSSTVYDSLDKYIDFLIFRKLRI